MFAFRSETPTGQRRLVVVSISDLEVALDENAAVVPLARLIALG